ncbi:type II toxin-antitoxin system Phd/YefM family antitoxin [Demequina sp. SO4-13]|uniref:type II toxin-antitoxin system Phd/YefM family antitoxin n=1 Tax=Demequina sp. SO4-13 TaxID=3401027 RepID=UPI003AF6AAC6
MEISATDLGPGLKAALDAAKEGETVVIIEDGIPVARLTGVESAPLLTRLEAEGLIALPAASRAVPRLPQAEAAKDALSSLLGRMRR